MAEPGRSSSVPGGGGELLTGYPSIRLRLAPGLQAAILRTIASRMSLWLRLAPGLQAAILASISVHWMQELRLAPGLQAAILL